MSIRIKYQDQNLNKGTDKGRDMVQRSIDKFGMRDAVVIDKNGEIISGNHRKKAANNKGITKERIIEATSDEVIAIQYNDIDLSTPEGKELALALNQTAKFNINIDEVVAIEELGEVVEEWGIEIPEELDAEEDDFDVPEGGIETDIVLGDLFEIGPHRLFCGDSTDSDQVARLMNQERAEIAFTSPPYNAGKTPTEMKMGKESKYANDNDDKEEKDYLQFLIDFTNNTLLFADYSFVNIQSLSGNKTALIDLLYEMKAYYADTLIWQKQNAQPAMANNVLNSQYEYVHCFSHKANRAIGTKQFRGTISNVIEISKQTKNEVKEHNATFPMEFAAFFVSNFCEQSVLDLFLGSGTTMVAAHQLKRKCYGMELDPKYCQVIIDRMLKLDPLIKITRNGEPYQAK